MAENEYKAPQIETNEHQGDQFRRMRRRRRRSGSWGRRRHAAAAESTAYRIVCDRDVLVCWLDLWLLSWSVGENRTRVPLLVLPGRAGAPPVGMEEQWERKGEQRSHGCAQRTSC